MHSLGMSCSGRREVQRMQEEVREMEGRWREQCVKEQSGARNREKKAAWLAWDFLVQVSRLGQLIYMCTPWLCPICPTALLPEANDSAAKTLQTSFENIRPVHQKWNNAKYFLFEIFGMLFLAVFMDRFSVFFHVLQSLIEDKNCTFFASAHFL